MKSKSGIRRFEGRFIDPKFAKETLFIERTQSLGVAVKGFGRTSDDKPSVYFSGLPSYYESVPSQYKNTVETFLRMIYKRDEIYFL